ncbi:DNA methyltransferase [Azorhizophilus paspali]|uniref:DNA methyltransferase n=1 Tax=Azorhizophilus paspali TaxID=69963 RepID=UPI00362B9AEF
MRELLSKSGSICIHIGMQVSHYVKAVADEIFGKANFNTEIVWSYGAPSGGRAAGNKMVKAHEYLLWYVKNYGEHFHRKEYLPYSEKYIENRFIEVDGHGRGIGPGNGRKVASNASIRTRARAFRFPRCGRTSSSFTPITTSSGKTRRPATTRRNPRTSSNG